MFSEKKLKVIITLYDYKLNSRGNSVVDFGSYKELTFDDFRIDCKIKKVPSPVGYKASVDIYGVSQKSLDQITTLAWINGKIEPKGIRIYEGKDNLLFEGGIMEAVPNYKSVPDVSIHIESSMLVYPNLTATPPSRLSSGTSISDFLKDLCSQYKYNCSCSFGLNYSWIGSDKIYNQMGLGNRVTAVCKDLDIKYALTTTGYRFFTKDEILKKTYKFDSSKYDGYPTFETFGCCISTDDLIDINCGDEFIITNSIIPYANATWNTNMIEYDLQSRKPNGKWEMKLHGTRVKK